MKKPIRHHYVPKCLIKHFCNHNNEIFIYIKLSGKILKSSPSHVFVEKNFNTVQGNTEIEKIYSEFENKATPIIDNIAKTFSLAHLTEEEWDILLSFIIVQKSRTHQTRKNIRTLQEGMLRLASPIANKRMPEKIKNCDPENENFIKASSFGLLKDLPRLLNALEFNKKIYLLRSNKKNFYIGDNPVAMHNQNFNTIYQGYGLAVPNIEIYMPLTNKITLAILDKHISCTNPNLSTIILPDYNVDFLNRLQIGWAETSFASKTNDFTTAIEFLSEHPDMKTFQEGNMRID